MAAVDLPGLHDYRKAGSSDGEVISDKGKQPATKKRRHNSKRSSSDHSSRDSDDSERRRRRRHDDEVDRRRRRREERHRQAGSDSEEDDERANVRKSTRRDYRRSRSQSRERGGRDGDYRRREDFEVRPRYWDSRSPDREREERRQRDRDRDRNHSRTNKDLYWNKYNRPDPRSDDKSNRKSNERESENLDPNSLKTTSEESKSKDVARDGQQLISNSKKSAEGVDGVEALTMRTGGAYIPPARLRMMQAALTDKQSAAYQRFAWEALKKSINGLINKINVSNIGIIVRELFKENIIRGRGVLARSIMQAQAASPTFTHVYAGLVSIINSKFPQIGELILTRLIILFRRGFRRNNKDICFSATRFIAHLVNQLVADDVIALEILTLLLQNATNDSVEVAVGFLKEVGAKLSEVSPKGLRGTFERLGSILNEGQIDKRVQYMVEVMFAIRKDGFKDHPSVLTELDLVQEEEQFTHLISLEKSVNGEDILNVFKHDPEYEATEEKYKTIRKEILDESSSDDDSGASGVESSSEEEDGEDDNADQTIVDNTETNLISLRRTIYLTIQSSLEFEECAHKLLKMELKPGQEVELCHMILDCCAQQRTYEKFFGLLAQRFCRLNRAYVDPFENIFRDSYETIHRLETNKLRNVAKLFAHLLHTDAINWTVLRYIKLNEEDTTSSSRIFIKILFQELSEYMGLPKLNERVKDPTLQEAFAGLFPRDNPCNTRFAINFFTSIGLGGLTDELREHLKSQPKAPLVPPPTVPKSSSSSSSSSSSEGEDSSSDSDDSNSSDESSSSDSSSESEDKYKTKNKKGNYERKQKQQKVQSSKKSSKSKLAEKPRSRRRRKEA